MAKAISTCLSDTMIFVVRLFVFVMFGNPLSMFCFNLFAPCKTAEFTKNKAIFGDEIREFYNRLAAKWPLFWARYWISVEDIYKYSVKRQVQYFLKVAAKNKTEAETLKAMRKENFWPKAYEILFFQYGNTELSYEETHKHIQNDCEIIYCVNITIAKFMMRNVRLSYNALQNVIKKAATDDDMCDELKKYLASGKLNDSQLELLIDAVTIEPGSGDLQMLGVLLDYVKRYGFSEKYMKKISTQYPVPFTELVREAVSYANKKRAKADTRAKNK